MNPEIDDPMVLISHHQYYPTGIYYHQQHQFVPQQGPTMSEGNKDPKPRRRQRNKKKKMKAGDHENQHVLSMTSKRKLSEEQVNMLEQSFGDEHKLESERKDRLAAELGLDPRQVAVWFQNRRARYKSKKLEEEYARLKTQHETTLVQKCRLEAELLKVKEQLDEAEKEIYRLSERSSVDGGFSSNSPSSTFSMEEPANFLGADEIIYVFYESDYIHGLEWDNNLYNYM